MLTRMNRKTAQALRRQFFAKAGPGVRLLKDMMDTVPNVAFYLKDAEGRIMALNPRNCEICNVPDEAAALGKRSSDILPLPLAEAFMARDRRVRETRTPLVGALNTKTADRSAHPRRVSTFPVLDRRGRVIGTASVICRERDGDAASLRADWARLQPALRHLERHFAERTSVAACARLVHMSETNFRRSFKKTLGCTPLAFLTSLRLAEAQRLLKTTSMRIADIALATGFCDHAHFIHAFRARHKATPGAYRRKGGGAPEVPAQPLEAAEPGKRRGRTPRIGGGRGI